jgi:hypothetical protein
MHWSQIATASYVTPAMIARYPAKYAQRASYVPMARTHVAIAGFASHVKRIIPTTYTVATNANIAQITAIAGRARDAPRCTGLRIMRHVNVANDVMTVASVPTRQTTYPFSFVVLFHDMPGTPASAKSIVRVGSLALKLK